ncbi:hypothetical protein [Pseudaminobacter soli (ex Li et al. 2025)]|uniref:hypothetical protein n=1 Tax=Pseudaminobacter soli (ex Li et al. 2025) TaxID=1295366 RepID=UPI0011B1CF22|nr:hypothetical protein [Mesorhizobium soli]
MEAKLDVAIVEFCPFGMSVCNQLAKVGHDERRVPVGVMTAGNMVLPQRTSATPLATRSFIQSARREHWPPVRGRRSRSRLRAKAK